MPSPTSPAAFPATAWTRVLTAQNPAALEARPAREEVCRIYWPPVYSFFRALGCDREDALDLTQELLADFCDGGGLERVSPGAGSLRGYLKSTARHRLINWRRDAAAKKRGGGHFTLSLEEVDDSSVPSDAAMADAYYDRRWAHTIFHRAMETLKEAMKAKKLSFAKR